MKEWKNQKARTAELLDNASDHNRDAFGLYGREKRTAGLALGTGYNAALVLAHADEALGKPLEDVTRLEWVEYKEALAEKYGEHALYRHCVQLKAYLRWRNPDGELTPDQRRALKQRQPPTVNDTRPISDAEFECALEACSTGRNPITRLRDQVVLWLLRDSGFRAHELHSLNVESVEFDEKGGAQLRLPKDAPLLKTGPRTVPIIRALPILRAWLPAHPHDDVVLWVLPEVAIRGVE